MGQNASDDDLVKFIHKFLVLIFTRTNYSSERPVDSILEQAVVFHNFSSIQGWDKPAQLINSLIGLQYISRVVLIHSSYLGRSSTAEYTPPNAEREKEGIKCDVKSKEKPDSSVTLRKSSGRKADKEDWSCVDDGETSAAEAGSAGLNHILRCVLSDIFCPCKSRNADHDFSIFTIDSWHI